MGAWIHQVGFRSLIPNWGTAAMLLNVLDIECLLNISFENRFVQLESIGKPLAFQISKDSEV